ncbi:MAG: ParB/RepB/Spo0J family partition protein [Alphaproteobacteria bacterium]
MSVLAPHKTNPMAAKSVGKGLGKGLSALLDDATVSKMETGQAENQLPIAQLTPSSVQPRRTFDDDALKSLAESIKAQGVLQPLLVRPMPNGKYEIIGGERRWRASQLAGLTHVPVIIRELDDGKALEVALVENVQRADLNPIDEAAGYLRLVNEFNYTHEDMARVTGKSRSHITNLLRLLSLPSKLKECVSNGLLTMGHARSLLGLQDDEGLQLRAANKVIKSRLSVRETEDLVRNLATPDKAKKTRRVSDPRTNALEHMMQQRLGMRVAIRQTSEKAGGSVRIFFDTPDELARLLQAVGAEAEKENARAAA